MGKPSPASRRAALEAERLAAETASRRRKVVPAVLGAVLALATISALLLWWEGRNQPAPATVGSQVAVPNASNQGRGITVAKTPAGKPTLVVYEDYQCPWCKVAHDELSPIVQKLLDDGEIGLEVRSLTLLDTMLKNDASRRANTAAACADIQGSYTVYRDALFAAQPKKEGDGYSDEQLRTELAAKVSDPAALRTCFDQRATDAAVQKVLDHAREADRDSSTPQYWAADEQGELRNQLDLKALMGEQTPTEQELLAAIKAAA